MEKTTTAFSSMSAWARVLAADMAAGVGAAKEPKRRLKNEMVGGWEEFRGKNSGIYRRGRGTVK